MTTLRRCCGLALPFALAACEPAPLPDDAAPAGKAAPRPAAAPTGNDSAEASSVNQASPEPPVEVPADAPGLAEMSPSRRRAYEAGYRDCLAGRYNPDPWPEAYRIGCGAAQEAQ